MTCVYNRCKMITLFWCTGIRFKQNFADHSANMLTYVGPFHYIYIYICMRSMVEFRCLAFFQITSILETPVLNISKKYGWQTYNVLCKRFLYHLIWLFDLQGKDRYPYPIGYNALRTQNGVSYKMEIHEGLNGPLFTVCSKDYAAFCNMLNRLLLYLQLWIYNKFLSLPLNRLVLQIGNHVVGKLQILHGRVSRKKDVK